MVGNGLRPTHKWGVIMGALNHLDLDLKTTYLATVVAFKERVLLTALTAVNCVLDCFGCKTRHDHFGEIASMLFGTKLTLCFKGFGRCIYIYIIYIYI